jgi:hypothetical protein
MTRPSWLVATLSLLAVLPVVSCRQVVGIEERSSRSSRSGVALSIADEGCRACVGASCGKSAEACLADDGCKPLADCVLSLARDDVAGRSRCEASNRTASVGAAYTELDACVRAGCLPTCYGAGGLFAGLPEQCSACLESPSPGGCKDEIAACIADAACEHGCSQAYAEPGQMTPVTTERCSAVYLDQDAEVSNLDSCRLTCANDCPFKHAWDCVGAFAWPTTTSTTITIQGEYRSLSLVKGLGPPVAGVKVEACAAFMDGCVPTSTTQTDDAGRYALPVEANEALAGWRGFLRISGASGKDPLFPLYAFPGRPYTADHRTDPQLVLTNPDIQLVAGVMGTKVIPGRAQLSVIFLDCSGHITPDVELSISPSAIVDEPGSETTFRKQVTSSVSAYYAFNARPGCVEITGTKGGDVTHRQRVMLFADAITSAIPSPRDSINDPVFSCTPPLSPAGGGGGAVTRRGQRADDPMSAGRGAAVDTPAARARRPTGRRRAGRPSSPSSRTASWSPRGRTRSGPEQRAPRRGDKRQRCVGWRQDRWFGSSGPPPCRRASHPSARCRPRRC